MIYVQHNFYEKKIFALNRAKRPADFFSLHVIISVTSQLIPVEMIMET